MDSKKKNIHEQNIYKLQNEIVKKNCLQVSITTRFYYYYHEQHPSTLLSTIVLPPYTSLQYFNTSSECRTHCNSPNFHSAAVRQSQVFRLDKVFTFLCVCVCTLVHNYTFFFLKKKKRKEKYCLYSKIIKICQHQQIFIKKTFVYCATVCLQSL